MRENIVVLGATGTIGSLTLSLLRYSFDYSLVGISFSSHYEKREESLLYFPELKYVGIVDEKAAAAFSSLHPSYVVFSGKDSSLKVIEACKGATVFNSIMGNDGLLPSLKAIDLNHDLLLANKESLVIGSSLRKKAREHSSSRLFPVDSEHVALAKLLEEVKERGIGKEAILSLRITASGGALRDLPLSARKDATPERVLRHPTWQRGSKITVDSATMVNKAFEIREAKALFPRPGKVSYHAVVCKESLVHALVSFVGQGGKKETIFEYSPCDRRVSIAYALSKGTLPRHRNSQEDREKVKKLHFLPLDPLRYPCFPLALKRNSLYGNEGRIFFNAVDSLAISSFLKKERGYLDIGKCLSYTLNHFPCVEALTKENLPLLLSKADAFAKEVIEKEKNNTCQNF